MMKRIVIGLTGMLGSGKSTVANIFREMGAEIIDTDKIVHELYNKNWILRLKIVRRFGISTVNCKLDINRNKLGGIVFRDAEKMRELEEIVWPYIDAEVEHRIKKSGGFVVIEAPLMKKAGAERFIDISVLVSAPKRLRRSRLKKSGMTDARIKKISGLQKSIHEHKKDYDYIISNDCSIDELKKMVKKLWEEIERR